MRNTKRFMSFVLVFAMLMTSLSCLGGVFTLTASATSTITGLDGIARTPGQHGNAVPKTEAQLASAYPDGYIYLSGTVYEFDDDYVNGSIANLKGDFEQHISVTDGYVNAGDYVIMLVKCTTSQEYLAANTYYIAHTLDFFEVPVINTGTALPNSTGMDATNTSLASTGNIMNTNNPDVSGSTNYGMTYKPTLNNDNAITQNGVINTNCGYDPENDPDMSLLQNTCMDKYIGYKTGSAANIHGEADLWSLGILYHVRDDLQDGAMGSIYLPIESMERTYWKLPGMKAYYDAIQANTGTLQANKRKGTIVTKAGSKTYQLSDFTETFDYSDFGATLCVGDPSAQVDTYTVTFYDSDNSVLSTIGNLASGDTVAFADAPTDYTVPAGQMFDCWVDGQGNQVSWPLTVTADTALYPSFTAASYTLTINYQYVNGTQAATTYTNTYAYNDTYSIDSPIIDGYTPDQTVVSGNITQNTTVTVTYTANTYTATFYDTDGTSVLGSSQAQYGQTIPSIANPTSQSGAIFLGWSETPGGSVVTSLGTMPIGGKSFYAKWQAATAHVTFYDSDLFSWLDEFDCEVGTDISLYAPTNYTVPAGEVFVGWFEIDSTTFELTDNQITIIPNRDLEVAPKFEAASFTVTFNDENNTFISSQTGNAGDTITPPTYAPTGYTVTWVDANNNPMPATIQGDATYHAVLTAIEYTLTVTYTTTDDSDAPADVTYQVPYGTQYDYPVTVPNGYTADITTVSGTMPATAVTVTVTLTPITYTLTVHYYYVNTTTPAFPDDTFQVAYNASQTVTPQALYGYSTSIAPATSTSVVMDQIGGKDYTIFYGANDCLVNIEYVYAGTGATAAPSAQAGDVFGASYSVTSPVIPGYTADLPVVSGTFTVDAPVTDPIPTITVTYTANAHTVTWVLDGGNIAGDVGPIVQNTAFGEAIVAPGTPEKSGFTFGGWTPAPAATVPDEDVTYTATWDAAGDTPYSVTVYTMGTDGVYDNGVTTPKTGVTGAPVDAASAALEAGFYYDVNHAGYHAADNIAADGTTALVVYVGRSQYDITFVIDGQDTVYDDQYYGAALTAPEAAKEGYTFTGWTPEVPATVPAADATYTAGFSVNSYPVDWTIDGTTTTDNVEFGTVPTAPEAAKEGYTFQGWFVTGDATEAIVDPIPAVGTAGAAYTAKFTINQYTLTFISNGEVYETITQDYGTAVTAPANPTMEGNDFSCWKVDGVATEVPATMPAQDMTFVASFGLASFTFTYVVDGVSTSKDYEYGDPVPAIAAPGKTGYTFTGWEPAWPETMPAGDYTVTAQFSKNTYHINATVDGVVTVYDYEYEDEINVPTPEKEGYTFSYWTPSLPATMPANDIDTTAVFSINKYDVSWTIDGVTTTNQVNYGTVPTAPAAAKEGYSFAGWFVTGDATETIVDPIPAVGVNGAAYTAKFTINTYTATFALNGGNIDGNTADVVLNVEYGGAITAPADPERNGYVFAGWSPEVDANIGAANVTYTAQWTQDTSYCTVKSVVRLGDDPYYECGIANWAITVEGSPNRIKICYDEEGYPTGWNYSRYNDKVLADGTSTGLVSIVDGENGTEIWTIRATIPAGGYKACAKISYTEESWEDAETGFDFSVVYDENTTVIGQVFSFSVDKTEVKRGGSVVFTIVTSDNINILRLADKVDNSADVTSTIGISKASVGEGWADNGNGTATWTLTVPVSYVDMNKASEVNTYSVYFYNEATSEFVDGEQDPVSITVTRYDTSGEVHEVDGQPVDPYSILDVTAALGKKLTYTNITVTTTSDVSKVRLTVGTKAAVYTKSSNNVTYTDNGDGTATWVIGYRFLTAGAYTIQVESRGNSWTDCSTATVSTTIYNNNAELAAAQG